MYVSVLINFFKQPILGLDKFTVVNQQNLRRKKLFFCQQILKDIAILKLNPDTAETVCQQRIDIFNAFVDNLGQNVDNINPGLSDLNIYFQIPETKEESLEKLPLNVPLRFLVDYFALGLTTYEACVTWSILVDTNNALISNYVDDTVLPLDIININLEESLFLIALENKKLTPI